MKNLAFHNLPIFQPSNPPTFHLARLALLFLVLISVTLAACQPYQFKGTSYPDPQPAPDFELAAVDGGRFRLSEHRGQIVLMFFGYTSCPDVCPTTLAEARRLLEDLEDDSEQLTFLVTTQAPPQRQKG